MNAGAAMRPLPDLHLVTEHVESLVIRLKDAGFQLLTYELDCSSMGTVAHPGRMVSAELLADTGMLVSLSGSDVGVVAGHLMVAAGPVREALGARQDETALAAAVRVAGELADQVQEVHELRAELRAARVDSKALSDAIVGFFAELDEDDRVDPYALADHVWGTLTGEDEHLTIDDEGAEGEGPVSRDMGGEG